MPLSFLQDSAHPSRQVAFDDYSADECQECWLNIQSRLRLQRTLGELMDDAQAGRWDMVRLRKAIKVRPNEARRVVTGHPSGQILRRCCGLGLIEKFVNFARIERRDG